MTSPDRGKSDHEEGTMSSTRTRKQRRATKAVLKFGPEARPVHKSKSGRTGQVRSSQLKGRQP